MEKCDLCGKECKTAQGLAGHKRWVHGVAPSSAQLRLEQPNPLITRSVLEQLLDERFAVISEQVDALSGELVQQDGQHSERIKQLEQRLSAAESKSIENFSAREKAEFLIPWMRELSGEDFVRLAINTGHDAQLVPAVDPEASAAIAETFRKQAEEATVIQGKTELRGYRYLEHIDLSIYVGEEELAKERQELIDLVAKRLSEGMEKLGAQVVNTVKIATELVANLAEIQRRREQAERKK